MTVNHAWRKPEQRKDPKLVPIEQMRAAVDRAANNATAFTLQMCQEQMLLMLHASFGFGRDRCMRALEDFQARMREWQDSVTQEFDAETFRMNYKDKQAHRTELAWTWAKHDEALEPLIDPEIWQPYKVRYRGFGGTGAWCDK